MLLSCFPCLPFFLNLQKPGLTFISFVYYFLIFGLSKSEFMATPVAEYCTETSFFLLLKYNKAKIADSSEQSASTHSLYT